MDFSRPRKSTDNAFIESFSGALWSEYRSVHRLDVTDAKIKLQAWQQECNEGRLHRSLIELSPLRYKARWAERRSDIR
jgi:putative transposase